MEYVGIICTSCNNNTNKKEEIDAIMIEYDEEFIKKIINTNYKIIVKICEHHTKLFKQLLSKLNKIHITELFCGDFYIINYTYILHYNFFFVSRDINFVNNNKYELLFLHATYATGNNVKKVSDKEFLDLVKTGTIIDSYDLSAPEVFEQFLASNGFLLKKIIKKTDGTTYKLTVIDTLTFTKVALK